MGRDGAAVPGLNAMRLHALNLILLASLAAGLAGCTAAGRSDADWPGRIHRLPPWRTGVPALLINVPGTYERGLRSGEDFTVHLLRRPPDVAPPETASLAVYVGRHPREPRVTDIREPVAIAGCETVWQGGSWPNEHGRTIYHAEAYVRGLFGWPTTWLADAQGLVVHVLVWGTEQAEVERLMDAARSLRLEP